MHRLHRHVVVLVATLLLLPATAGAALAGGSGGTTGDTGTPEEGNAWVAILLGAAVLVGVALIALVWSRKIRNAPPRRGPGDPDSR